MESTIRFDSIRGYKCKQLNLVTSDKTTNVESINNTSVLVVRKYAKADLEVDYDDKDFSLKIKDISMDSVKSTGPFNATVFFTFGYVHSEYGLPTVISVSSVAKDLEVTKVNNTVTVKYDNTIVGTLNNVIGPIRGLRIKPVDGIVDPSDVTSIVELRIGDIEYSS